MWSVHELIVAPATVRGSGARAVVRFSGDGLDRLLGDLFTATAGGFVRQGERPRLVQARIAAGELTTEWGELPVEILPGEHQGGRPAVGAVVRFADHPPVAYECIDLVP